jgi:hypothetical protein
MTKDEQTARDLLKLHGGSCSVPRNGPIHLAFCQMQEVGEVRITKSSTEGLVDVYARGHKGRFMETDL